MIQMAMTIRIFEWNVTGVVIDRKIVVTYGMNKEKKIAGKEDRWSPMQPVTLRNLIINRIWWGVVDLKPQLFFKQGSFSINFQFKFLLSSIEDLKNSYHHQPLLLLVIFYACEVHWKKNSNYFIASCVCVCNTCGTPEGIITGSKFDINQN